MTLLDEVTSLSPKPDTKTAKTPAGALSYFAAKARRQNQRSLRSEIQSAASTGSIDVEELGNIMRSLGEDLSKKQLRVLIKEIDTDGNGTISRLNSSFMILTIMEQFPLKTWVTLCLR